MITVKKDGQTICTYKNCVPSPETLKELFKSGHKIFKDDKDITAVARKEGLK